MRAVFWFIQLVLLASLHFVLLFGWSKLIGLLIERLSSTYAIMGAIALALFGLFASGALVAYLAAQLVKANYLHKWIGFLAMFNVFLLTLYWFYDARFSSTIYPSFTKALQGAAGGGG